MLSYIDLRAALLLFLLAIGARSSISSPTEALGLPDCPFDGKAEHELSQNTRTLCPGNDDTGRIDPKTEKTVSLTGGKPCKTLADDVVYEPTQEVLGGQEVDDLTNPVFVGFHGTQTINAKAFEAGGIKRPRLTSGADAELGEGLYVTDDLTIAMGFANNARVNVNRIKGVPNNDPKAVQGFVCKIFAVDIAIWRETPKFWFPVLDPNGAKLIKDSHKPELKKIYEDNRKNFAQNMAGFKADFVRFGQLDLEKPDGINQFSIPEGLQGILSAKCYLVDPAEEIPGYKMDPALKADGEFPAFSFKKKIPAPEWDIRQAC